MPEDVITTIETHKVPHAVNRVTPLSKYLALALFVTLPFLGVYVGYSFAPVQVVEVEKIVVEQSPENSIPPAGNNSEPVTDENLPEKYDRSGYRVVSVVKNPFYSDQTKYDALIIATPRGVNDYTCGGMYVPANCHLFLESSYAYTETPIYLGVWNKGLIKTETVRFISPTEITFDSGNGDAGFGYSATWQLDLFTGSSTQTAYEEFHSE